MKRGDLMQVSAKLDSVRDPFQSSRARAREEDLWVLPRRKEDVAEYEGEGGRRQSKVGRRESDWEG